ncbi:TIGR02453 family protein [Porphyromonadaceae bacterium NLAE-zl-C104]|nr:TIGR02453 family protein [Porphyromonadaceae bacterium NLAE-zl-C104]
MDFCYTFDFLARLQINNDRNWFHEHKFEYDQIRADFENFINRLIVPLAQLDPDIGSVTANESVFRIYRDTRFSHDKTPYKTHLSAFIANGGKKTRFAGYYIHIQPDESFFAGGIYSPDPAALESIRNEIYHQPEEIRSILDNRKFKKTFPELSAEDRLKNPPKGYPKDFKEIELLKNKHFITHYPLENEFFQQEGVIHRLVELCKIQYPLNAFFNRAVKG